MIPTKEQVEAMGERVLGSKELFQKWLSEPNFALGGMCGQELMDTSHGLEQLIYVLGQMEFGQF